MTRYIKKSELEKMKNTIIDDETGMTELDYAEWSNPYQDWVIIDDMKVKEN